MRQCADGSHPGGVIVYPDACTRLKAYSGFIENHTIDPFAAISRGYLQIPCSCMAPDTQHLTKLDKITEKYKPDVVIDVVLHARYSCSVESSKGKENTKFLL